MRLLLAIVLGLPLLSACQQSEDSSSAVPTPAAAATVEAPAAAPAAP
jgi:hypothetical protein